MTENIIDMVKRVAHLRSQVEVAKERKRGLLAAWEEEHALLLTHLNGCSAQLAEAENALREGAIHIYQETGSKEPGPGVQIRVIPQATIAQDLEAVLREKE